MTDSCSKTGLPDQECADGSLVEDELRARTYSLLSHLLYEPPDASLRQRLASIEGGPADTETVLGAAWRLLGGAARRAADDSLRSEYQALFIGLGQGEVVPYGSWYLTGFLMEQPLAQLRTDLKMLGIERKTGVCEPEDHAAGLCAVMALLANGEAAVPVERQQEFFTRHLDPWILKFFRDLQQAPSASFYRAVGQLGERFIEVEQQAFRMSLPPARSRRPARPAAT